MNDSITIISNVLVKIAVHIFGRRVFTDQMNVLKVILTCVDSVTFPILGGAIVCIVSAVSIKNNY